MWRYGIFMKKLPELNLSYEGLFNILNAPLRSKLMLVGIELKIFNILSEPMSHADVAKIIGTHQRNTRVYLDSLASIDLLIKKDGLYRNSPVAQAFLVDDSPTYLGRVLTWLTPDDQFLQNLPKLVKEGPPLAPKEPSFSDEMLIKGVEVIADVEKVNYCKEAVNILLDLPEFSSFQKMLDLGGGPGLIGMAIVDAHPSMKGIIFDLPPVIEEAKKFIKEYEMEDRMTVLSGDLNKDSIGDGYDLVWASAVFQFAADIDMVVKKVYDSLKSGGVLVSLMPFGLTHERTKPESVVLSLLPMALMGQEMEIDQGYVSDSMLRVGFRNVHSWNLNTYMGPMELDIARKS
jgi:hypothetical protein